MATINGTGNDETLTGTEDADTINGLGGNDILNGLGGNDELNGGDDADRLAGGTGVDTMTGGFHNDVYMVDNGGDQVNEAAGGGSDTVITNVSYTLAAGQEIELLRTYGSATTVSVDLTGNAFANSIVGNNAANRLDGKGGADVMWGYGGDDTYYVDHSADIVAEAAGGGSDTIITNVSFALVAGREVELLRTWGSATTIAVDLTGNAFANTIVGNAAANVIDGKGGADVMWGCGGDDTYYVGNSADRVTEAVGGGSDTVITTVSFVLGAGQEVELLRTYGSASTNAINLTGNEFANTLVGNNGANILDGKDGADRMYGYGGDDTYYVNDDAEIVTEAVGGGSDTVIVSIGHTLAAGQEVELLRTYDPASTDTISLVGNEFVNTIVGNNGENFISGEDGADTMYGHGGDDIFYVDNALDVVVEAVGGGHDRIYAFVSYTLAAGQEVELLAAPTGVVVDITGNEFANWISGNNAASVFDGKGGADAMDGHGGADNFAFTTALGGGNVDSIGDFQVGIDKIALDDAIFAAVGAALDASEFRIGAAAADADDRIVYNSGTGQLFYDADGNGAGAAVQFASLPTGLAITASDFTVI